MSAFAKLPDHLLQDIKSRVSIVAVVGRYVELKRAGRSHKGLCPFHKDSAPSFTVSEERGFYHCFGCSAHGDAIKFIQEMENLSFMEAVKQLAEETGVELPEVRDMSPAERLRLSETDQLYAVNRQAMELFQQQLIRQPKDSIPWKYLEKRGVNKEMIERFRLGYAPEGWDNLLRAMSSDQTPQRLEKAGLVAPGKRNGYYDRFRNRLMFPIIMQHDRVVGFGGRTLADDNAKYINSPESPIFSKSDCLYGYHVARGEINRKDRVLVVEGNLDVVMMHQFGFEETVATLGTALTQQHIRFLKRMTRNLVLLFDGDEAGQKAMFRSLDLFLSDSVNARAVILPDNHDPDSFLKAEGAEAMGALLDNAQYLFDIWLEAQYLDQDMGPRGTSDCLQRIVPMLAKIADIVERELYVQKIASRLNLRQQLLMQLLRQNGTKRNWERLPDRAVIDASKGVGNDRYASAEEELVSLLYAYPQIVAPRFLSEDVLDKIQNEPLMRVAAAILDMLEDGEQPDPSVLLDLADDTEWKNRIANLIINSVADEESVQRSYDDCIKLLSVREIEHDIRRVKRDMAGQNGAASDEKANRAQELVRLYQKLHGMKTNTAH